MKTFTINTSGAKKPFPHYWETCVGSCHAPTALREDYRKQLRKCHNELGFRYVRFHGILDDDMSVCLRDGRTKQIHYNFSLIDNVFDFLLSIGMKPFVELGFLPSAFASSKAEVFNYRGNVSVPENYDGWDELIDRLVRHLIDRYGLPEVRSWFFEVWNEPNLPFFYAGTQQDYFNLYDHTAAVIKGIDPLLKVGGPATSINDWIPEMIDHCESTGTPLDFISTHHYPTDDPLWQSGETVEEYFSKIDFSKPEDVHRKLSYRRGVLTDMTRRAKSEAKDYPLYYTEWNTSARDTDLRHDVPYSAAFVAKTLMDNSGLVDVYSFWTFTDIFEENGQRPGEFHGGFGMLTEHAIPKPVYRAFQLLHALGDECFEAGPEQGTVGLTATEENGVISALVYNHDIPENPPPEETVTLVVDGAPIRRAEILRVDETHANPYPRWVQMGSPDYLSAGQVAELKALSCVTAEPLPVEGGKVTFVLPPDGLALVRMYR